VLLIEYTDESPVRPGETIVYGDGDRLPSGVTGVQFVALMQAASARRGLK
jgi:hypothetical protein